MGTTHDATMGCLSQPGCLPHGTSFGLGCTIWGKMSPTNRFFINKLGFVDHVCHQEIGILINKTGIYLATCCDLSKRLLGVDQAKLGAKQQNWRWKANKAGAVANEIWSGSNKNVVFSWEKSMTNKQCKRPAGFEPHVESPQGMVMDWSSFGPLPSFTWSAEIGWSDPQSGFSSCCYSYH